MRVARMRPDAVMVYRPAMTSFESMLRWAELGENRYTNSIPASWAQGRATFGGLVTAAGVRLVRRLVHNARIVRSVDTQFLGPVKAEVPVVAETELLREGRFMTQAETRFSQDGALCARVTTTFGAPRDSALVVRAPSHAPTPPEGIAVGYIEGVSPAFLQHMALRWSVGEPPFTGAAEALCGGHCRHGTEARGDEAVLGLLDAWPAPVLPMAQGGAMASTVRWTAHLVGDAPPPEAWCFFEARAVTAGDGYASTLGHLYGPDGALVAWMEQLVAVFDKV